MRTRKRRVLAIASGGGHWVQLRRLAPAFDGFDVAYATVHPSYASEVPGRRFYAIRDATRWDRFGLLVQLLQVAWVLLRERPDVIVTTGAAPGFFALAFGKLLRARTVWIDSIANVEELSGSGARVGPFADLWLTQWPHLARTGGPRFGGATF